VFFNLKRIVVEIEKCAGCRYCELACSGFHFREFSPMLSRINVIKKDLKGLDYPVVCHQCDPCVAVEGCLTGALSQSNSVVTVGEGCEGCGHCVNACKFGAIKLVHGRGFVCDLCGGEPECVKRCPTGALIFIEYNGVFEAPEAVMEKMFRRWFK
jgi:Fe-S-cluster-containing hydrogenase component 2